MPELTSLRDMWRRVTLRRHRSELRALGFARRVWPFSLFPIVLNLMFWWFVFCMVALAPLALGMGLIEIDFLLARILGIGLLAAVGFSGLIILPTASPWIAAWFFRWYFIAAGLMFGRTKMADKKEAELVAAIAKESAQGPTP